jgi:type III pantothenate kinase
MLLTIDIGNSNICIVIYDDHKQRLFDVRYETIKQDPQAAYTHWIDEHVISLCERYHVKRFILSSVVPAVTAVVMRLLSQRLGLPGHLVSLDSVPGFTVKLTQPHDIGADFIGTSYGVFAKYPLPAIVADLGSATKLSALNVQETFEGGVIIPGIRISRDALSSFIPHLPTIEIEVPQQVIGRDTIGAMESGLMYGHIEAVRGLASRMAAELGEGTVKILTGGFAAVVYPYLPEFIYEPHLLNDGLYEVDRQLHAK